SETPAGVSESQILKYTFLEQWPERQRRPFKIVLALVFSCLCLAAACAIIEKNRAQYAPKTGGSRYGKNQA
ncbi:MAG: hypothetical protein ACLTYY_07165, partial [Faecalibacterium prausnitzii]